MPRTPPWRNCRRKAGLQRYIGLRLFAFLGMSDSFWIGLQTDYDTARFRELLADILARIQPYAPLAGIKAENTPTSEKAAAFPCDKTLLP